MSPESGTIDIEQIDAVSEHATVRHYDEPDEEIKDRFPELVTDGSLDRTEQDVGDVFDICDCEVVKFIDYYHIIRGEY